MISGDLDLERARRDDAYRRLARAFLVLGPHAPLTAYGFSDLPRPGFTLRRFTADEEDADKYAAGG